MAIQSQPSRISEPFAGSGTKNTIPATNATPSASQAASWASGFPPECSQPISAGGCPVPRNDVNGVLNWLSQGFAFQQDGGIWEWSALADYDTERMVRGSDGKLYWSVAQNGPGFASGAVDPTTDDGTYWSSPALRTMPLADKSAKGATTEWVKDLAVAPVYLDPAGSDSDDGLSAATAVQTFAKAIEIGTNLHGGTFVIQAASGTYTGDVACSGSITTQVHTGGDITINGNVTAVTNSSLVFTATSHNITVNGYVSCSINSLLYFNCSSLSITPSNHNGLTLSTDSCCYITGDLTLLVLNATHGIDVYDNSCLSVDGTLKVTVDITSHAIYITNNSQLSASSQLVYVNSQDPDNNHSNTRATSALYVNNCSSATIRRLQTTNIFSESCCLADNCSCIYLLNGGYLHGPKTNVTISTCLGAIHGSTIYVAGIDGGRLDCLTHNSGSRAILSSYSSNLTIYNDVLVDTYAIGTGSGGCNSAFAADYNSFLIMVGASTIYTLDSINASNVFYARACSTIDIGSAETFVGNANANSSCKKYNLSGCSVFVLHGRSATNLPGPQAGSATNNSVTI